MATPLEKPIKKSVPFFADPDVSDEAKQAARVKGGRLGGRKRAYVKGTSVPLDSLDAILDGLGEVIGNLKEMDLSVSVMNSLISAYRVASACYLEQQERDELLAEIDAIKAALGVE